MSNTRCPKCNKYARHYNCLESGLGKDEPASIFVCWPCKIVFTTKEVSETLFEFK